MGKGCIALCAASLLLEDKQIDHILIGCESAKLHEWADELAAFTDIEGVIYAGTKTKREKLRQDLPPVIIGVFETLRNDLSQFENRSDGRGRITKSLISGELLGALEGKRVLAILDEAPAKMGASRQSYMYKSFEHAVRRLSKDGEFRSIVPSATPVDRDVEGYFNLIRLLDPGFMKVKDFYRDYVQSFDLYDRAQKFQNINADFCNPRITSFKERTQPYLIAKNKNDPDVAHLFPVMPVPDYTYTRLADKTQDFYEQVIEHFTGEKDRDRTLFTLCRQIAGHPQALFHSEGDMAQEVVRLVGEKFICTLESTKLEQLIYRLKMFRREGAQVVAFTFFGQSILPLIHQRLLDEKFSVSINHGQLSSVQKEQARKEFTQGETEIFLTSDAGARGINLPTGQYVEEFDVALKHSIHTQRINRVSRVNSKHSVVFSHTFVAKDTIEDGVVSTFLNRTEGNEELMGEDGPINAKELRNLLEIKRQ
jgi:SNF2 family DNA or RNA helicase